MDTIKIPESSYEILKKASEKSKVPIVKLAEAIITKEINWLNDPVKIAKYFSMVRVYDEEREAEEDDGRPWQNI